MNYYICFELISNTYLYNIIFINNLSSHSKNSGFVIAEVCGHEL